MKTMMMLAAVSVSVLAHAGSDTIAFYPFSDAAPGVSAIGTVTNAMSAETMVCTVGEKGSSPQVVFSSEAPGMYLYESSAADAQLLVSGLQSIDLGQGDPAVSSAFLSIPDAPQALAGCHATGYTIEFFFRLPPDAPVPGYSATLQYDCGYEFEGTAYPFKLYLPCKDGVTIRYGLNGYNDADSAKGGFHGKITLSAPVNDGEWHHFAVVERVSSSTVAMDMYIDGILVRTHSLPEGVTCNDVLTKESPEFKVVRGAMSGNLAGLRISSVALDPVGFLVASGRAPGDFGDDVLGFYPFDDGEEGESAVGETVFNAAQPMFSPCMVTTNRGDSVAVFSSEGPAKYVFVGERYGATPYYTDPGSVFLSSPSNGCSGTLLFDRMATELSKYPDGHTVEWFFKLTDDKIARMGTSYYCDAGYLHNGVEKQCGLCLPFAMDYDGGRQFRFSLGYYDNAERRVIKSLDYLPQDGLWHHIAIVGSSTNLEIFVDYVSYGEVAVDGMNEVTENRHLELVRNALHGKFSCVKVTARELDADEFLRASNVATYWPRTLSHVTFDGTAGGTVSGTAESAAVSFAAANPGIYSAQDCSGGLVLNGGADGNPVYSVNRACRQPLVSGEGEPRENTASVYTVSTGAGDAGFRPAPHFRMPVSQKHELPSDFTMEGFFRFDKDSWAAGAGEYAQGRDRLNLMSRKHPSGCSWKLGFVNVLSEGPHKLYLYAYWGTGTEDFTIAQSLPVFKDDAWHHIAVTHDSSLNRMIVYCDYKPVITNDIGKALYAPASGYLAVGDGQSVNDNDFHGWVDEVRYSGVCLDSAEFLKQDSIPVGMTITIR